MRRMRSVLGLPGMRARRVRLCTRVPAFSIGQDVGHRLRVMPALLHLLQLRGRGRQQMPLHHRLLLRAQALADPGERLQSRQPGGYVAIVCRQAVQHLLRDRIVMGQAPRTLQGHGGMLPGTPSTGPGLCG